MRQQKQLNAKTLWGRVIFWPLFLLAVAPLVLAAPAHTTPVHVTDDNNTIELTVGSDAELKQSPTNSYLYEATMPVTVYDKTADLRGFNLTIHADSAALVNNLDNSRRIEGTTAFIDKGSGREVLMGMNANSWGYRLEEGYGTKFRPDGFMHPPAGSEPPSVIVDTASEYDNAGCKGKKKCEVHMTFGAAINPTSLAAGTYSATVTYTATAKPKPAPAKWTVRTAKTNPSELCQSGNSNSSCLVDLDPNMIPVKYIGDENNAKWMSVADPEAPNSGWYNYANKQWANAITVKPEALARYKGYSEVVNPDDILGFWVYIPRYAYEVMRRDGTDKPVKEQNFDIKFENTKTPKKRPLACKTGKSKDYRTECNVSRELPVMGGEVSTWATHPAFTFGKKELNGIWVGKFETTGTPTNPTILPNQRHLSGNDRGVDQMLGRFYTVAKSLGVKDPANTYGDQAGADITQNSHHLNTFSSRMPTNSDWGVIVYLSASRYGAGHNNVQINQQSQNRTPDSIGNYSYGTTGCGPGASGNKDTTYTDGGALGTQSACSTSNLQRAYNGSLGQLASTTNNPTGIYDLAGGGFEYVSAARTTDNSSGQITDDFTNTPRPPYISLYYNIDKDNLSFYINSCIYESCGGQALYETNNGEYYDDYNQWHGQQSYFVNANAPWVTRGGLAFWSYSGAFYVNAEDGKPSSFDSLRVVLAPTAQN